MREFDFDDGDPTAAPKGAVYDARDRRCRGWSREDFHNALDVYKKTFGSATLDKMLTVMVGTTVKFHVPPFMWGKVIAVVSKALVIEGLRRKKLAAVRRALPGIRTDKDGGREDA